MTVAERSKAENDVRTTLIQALGGLMLLSGLLYTARTFWLTQQGQIASRFADAVGQLGADESYVRTGAVFALERLANDSPLD